MKNVPPRFLWGTEEPDRLVIMGNHRDAWLYGSIDPSSGTAVMMEVSRSIGELVKVSLTTIILKFEIHEIGVPLLG